MLDEVCRAYPEARVVPDALLALGSLYEQARRLVRGQPTPTSVCKSSRRTTIAGFRRSGGWRTSTRRRQLLVSARDSYLELLARFPKQSLAEDQAASATRRRAGRRPSWRGRSTRRSSPTVPSRRLRCRFSGAGTGSRETASRSRRWPPTGVAPSLDAGRVFLVEKTGLRLLDPDDRRAALVVRSGAPAVWAGYLSDKLIVATPRQIAALELSQGTVQWRFDARQGAARTPIGPTRSRTRPMPRSDPKRRRAQPCRTSSS